MYQFPDYTYDFSQQDTGVDHLDYTPITRDVLGHQATSAADVNDILATQGSPPVVPASQRGARRTGQNESRSVHNNFYDPQEQGAIMPSRPSTGQLLFHKLSNMESQINKISQDSKTAEKGTDTSMNERGNGENGEHINAKVNRLSERMDNLEKRLSSITDALDELMLLPRRMDSYSKWLHDFARTFDKENERVNTMSSGVDDACRRFHHLLSRLSRHRDSDDLMRFYDSEEESMGVAI
ncbi:hypothetical protein BDV29DRAFT_161032 [Aspergillus leporis]|uniref:Uncharacterized protein n=1 Tax=Aspergillus leporis TaxID=41062 RepID=A0A5N5WMS7_9EURO|nr:hypothetical protein BDV29DRAFT_161032 [Aspergillus leporis]